MLSPVAATDLRHNLTFNREQTLEKLYARAYPMVLHYVKQNQGTADDAKDILQEAIILLFEKVMHGRLELTVAVTTYIMGICKNLWRKELEKRSRKQPWNVDIEDNLWEEITAEPETPVLSLTNYVEQLGEKCKTILLSFYYFGQRMEQIAEKHAYSSIRSATVQKFKCLERLRKSLASLSIGHFKN
ncbi:sigma-70 family RNA polymerase sigma factor [Rhodocytophaga rosea]|uniref:Sigma-70 family RNA polymerase sigma factor n=2 Tax=Rhodocytophaga rosea TaxID=2704465 RepID=A0A6C0GV86_9BACT|nr:sigma-70 family RNA polymerase sigma factor [Rhodocytophaga rosea]